MKKSDSSESASCSFLTKKVGLELAEESAVQHFKHKRARKLGRCDSYLQSETINDPLTHLLREELPVCKLSKSWHCQDWPSPPTPQSWHSSGFGDKGA